MEQASALGPISCHYQLHPENGQCVWRYPQAGSGDSWGGTMTTAGDLVFFGNDAKEFEAAARAGQPLWHLNTGQSMHAFPMSHAVDNKQYVAITSGSDLFSFALP